MEPAKKGLGDKRKARKLALQALYEADCIPTHKARDAAERVLSESRITKDGAVLCLELVSGVISHRDAIDSILRERAPLWPLEQLSPVDRNVLRIAIYEMIYSDKIPKKAAINEAVELAKVFGSGNSAKFVNGVLGAVYGESQEAKAQ